MKYVSGKMKTKLRMTRQRRIILEELQKTRIHPTADKVYEMVRKKLPRISLGTIYRNLEILHDQGMIQKLEVAGKQKRFDGNPEFHYHVRCVNCSSIGDIYNFPGIQVHDNENMDSDYTILGHKLEFFGICPRCKAQAKKQAKRKVC